MKPLKYVASDERLLPCGIYFLIAPQRILQLVQQQLQQNDDDQVFILRINIDN